MELSIETLIILLGFALIVVMAWKYLPPSILDPKDRVKDLIEETKSKAADVQRLHEIIHKKDN